MKVGKEKGGVKDDSKFLSDWVKSGIIYWDEERLSMTRLWVEQKNSVLSNLSVRYLWDIKISCQIM